MLISAAVCCAVGVGLTFFRGGRLVSVVQDLVRKAAAQPPRWPDARVELHSPAAALPAGFGKYRILVDPGHGAEGNSGNSSAFCEDEQDFTLRVGLELAAALARTGHFEARLSRPPGLLVPYPQRVAEAERWSAQAFISLHSDVRGQAQKWSPAPDLQCSRSEQAPGFAVLYSDLGPLAEPRRRLALAVARRLIGTGLLPYDGEEYYQIYEAETHQPGVFIDRHEPAKQIFVLRRPTMPSIIIETHNAWDPREATRWRQQRTLESFQSAVINALIDALTKAPSKGMQPDL